MEGVYWSSIPAAAGTPSTAIAASDQLARSFHSQTPFSHTDTFEHQLRDTEPADLIRSSVVEEDVVGTTPTINSTHWLMPADCRRPQAPQQPILSILVLLHHGWRFKPCATTGVSPVRIYQNDRQNKDLLIFCNRIGIILAVGSGVLIGASFVFKKKGLLSSQKGKVAGEGLGYLKSVGSTGGHRRLA